MKTQSLRWLIGLGAVASSFASCTEPATECLTGLAQPFATVFTVKSAPAPAGCEMASPNVVQLGDLIGFEWYHPPSADMTTYNDAIATVAIKTSTMGSEDAQYTSGCGAAACAMPLPCTFVPAGDAGPGSNGDSDCDPTGKLTGVCADTSTGTACGANSASCACTATTCVAGADCGAGSACVNGSCVVTCGPIGDGCGNMLTCASCPAGQTCGGGGTPSVCGSGSTCTPATCASLGADCGPAADGCGGLLQCGGSCPSGQTCGGAGTPNVCGVRQASDPTTLSSLGAFAQHYPDGNDMCQVTGLTAAAQTFTSISGSTTTSDTLGTTWDNVNVYVTATAQGTQFSADVTYTENGCSATYHAVGVWPAVDCTVPVPDPNDPRGLNTIGVQPDDDKCNPCAEPSIGRFTGSGIIPNFPVKCGQLFPTTCTNGVCQSADPFGRDPYYCILQGAGDPPQLNPNPPTCE
jgi:hypothetical protein